MANDQIQRFQEAYAAWDKERSEGQPRTSVERILGREYRSAWHHGNDKTKLDILFFLGETGLPGSEDIVWASLRAAGRPVVALGLVVAIRYVLAHHLPNPEAVSTLIDIARNDPNDDQRWMALHVLTLAEVNGLRSWLEELAERDPSVAIRREANVALMRKGHVPAKAALLKDLRQHPDNFGVATDLWSHRQILNLTEDEQNSLRQVLLRYIEWLRGRLHDPDENESARDMAVGMLGSLVRDGFPHHEEDADAVGEFATSASELSARLGAVETLAAFNTPRARRWLEDLAVRKRPSEVAECARRLLGEMQPEGN